MFGHILFIEKTLKNTLNEVKLENLQMVDLLKVQNYNIEVELSLKK